MRTTTLTTVLRPRLPIRNSWLAPRLSRGFAGTSLLAFSSATHKPSRTFADRHIGPNVHESRHMLSVLGYESMDQFVSDAIPDTIRIDPEQVSDATIPPLSEADMLREAKEIGARNMKFRSYIGMGYHTAVVPTPIMRSVGGSFRRDDTPLIYFSGHGGPLVVHPVYSLSARDSSR
jgi:hypothetical protein